MSGKNIGMVLGLVLLLVGILGLVGFGVGIVGPDGFFTTDTTHDVVHLITGAILLWVVMKAGESTGMVFKVLGIIYLLIAILGFFGGGSVFGLMVVDTNDNILHLVLGVILLWAGMKGARSDSMMSSGM